MPDLRTAPRIDDDTGTSTPVRSRRFPHLGAHSFLMLASVLVIFPFVWQVVTSFKTLAESLRIPPTPLPREFDASNYVDVFDQMPLLNMFGVSVAYALVLVLGHVFLGSMAAYAFACLRFPFRNALFYALLSLLMVPRQMFLLPQYEIIQGVGLTNTFAGLAAPHFVGFFTVFLMRQFFLSLPRELMESAKLDGAGPFRTYFSVMLPLAKPGLIAATIVVVLYSWNDLLWPLIVISDERKSPLSVGLANFQGEFLTDRPMLMAAATLASVPLIVLFLFLQKQFIQGIAFTGSK